MTALQTDAITCLIDGDAHTRVDIINRSCEKIFGWGNPDKVRRKLDGQKDIALHQICDHADEIVAFKLGFAEDHLTFYSWLGGVIPGMRGRNLARLLMIAQHRWAADRGYHSVTTRTELDNARMSAINIAAGFSDDGIMVKDNGRKLRCFRKILAT